MTALRAVLIVLAIYGTAAADGDVVQLRNGDRLTGTIGKMDGEKVTITTPYAKDVAIDWKEVASVQSTTSHWVRLQSGDFVQARFAPGTDGVTLESGEMKTTRPVPLDQIVSIGVPPGPKYTGSVSALVRGRHGKHGNLQVRRRRPGRAPDG